MIVISSFKGGSDSEEELNVYRSKWWIRPTQCLKVIVLISKKRCQPCVASRMRRMNRTMKIGRKVPPRGGKGNITGGIPHLRHHHDDGLDTDGAGKPDRR